MSQAAPQPQLEETLRKISDGLVLDALVSAAREIADYAVSYSGPVEVLELRPDFVLDPSGWRRWADEHVACAANTKSCRCYLPRVEGSDRCELHGGRA